MCTFTVHGGLGWVFKYMKRATWIPGMGQQTNHHAPCSSPEQFFVNICNLYLTLYLHLLHGGASLTDSDTQLLSRWLVIDSLQPVVTALPIQRYQLVTIVVFNYLSIDCLEFDSIQSDSIPPNLNSTLVKLPSKIQIASWSYSIVLDLLILLIPIRLTITI